MDNRVEIVGCRIESQGTVCYRRLAPYLSAAIYMALPYVDPHKELIMHNEFTDAGSTVYVDKALGMVFRFRNLTFVPSCPHAV